MRRNRTEHEEKKVITSLQQDIRVEHRDVQNEMTKVSNDTLKMIGQQVGQGDAALVQAEYMGSAAVHIYKHPKEGTFLFVSQVDGTIGKTPEAVASAGFTNLQNKMMGHYGRTERRKL